MSAKLGRPVLTINQGSCSEEGCERKPLCRGVCARHYARLHYVEHERQRRGHQPALPMQVGDTRVNAGGYVEEKVGPGGRDWTLQHRYVMQQAIGRLLRPEETVHHRNGQRTDNRIENLELWASVQPKGQRVEDLLAFAEEIMTRYGATR